MGARGIHPKNDDIIIFPMDLQNYCLFATLNYFKPHIETIGNHKDDLISFPKATSTSGALYPVCPPTVIAGKALSS